MRKWTKIVIGEILFITMQVLLIRVNTELVTHRRAWLHLPGDSRVLSGGYGEVGTGRVRIIEVPKGNVFILVLGPTTLTQVSKWADFCVASHPVLPGLLSSSLPRPYQERSPPQGPPAQRPGLL